MADWFAVQCEKCGREDARATWLVSACGAGKSCGLHPSAGREMKRCECPCGHTWVDFGQ